MSILIKGMDKPTDCGLCPFEDFGYCNVKGERNTSESGVDADCPLIEVADRKTEPTISKMEQVDEPQIYCDTCGLNKKCKTAFTAEARHCQNESRFGKDEPQTEEERCRDVVRGFIDIVNDMRNPTEEEKELVNKYIESISIPTGVNVFDLMDKPQTEDGIMPEVKAEVRFDENNKTLWIKTDTVENYDRVIIEDGSNWCRIFYEECGECAHNTPRSNDEPQTDCSWK